MQQFAVYTDGACVGNPGPGGYGVVILGLSHGACKRVELDGGYRMTTNNRMELMAAIRGLEYIREPSRVAVYSDAKYVVHGIAKGWAKRWRAKGWMKNRDELAKNADLWNRLLDECNRHFAVFRWVRGHAGDTQNERCDFLAERAARGRGLAIDSGYEQPAKPDYETQELAYLQQLRLDFGY